MDTTNAFVARIARSVRRFGGTIALPTLVIAVAALAGVLIGDLLAPASEPVIVAPFRW
jgi:hypothetical protein